jgi:hypothetical protein
MIIPVKKFKAIMKTLPIKHEYGMKAFDEVEKRLKGVCTGKIISVNIPEDYANFLEAAHKLGQLYRVAQLILSSRKTLLFHCVEYTHSKPNRKVEYAKV